MVKLAFGPYSTCASSYYINSVNVKLAKLETGFGMRRPGALG